MTKDDCFTPCENDVLVSDSEIKGGDKASRQKGVPINIDVKSRLRRIISSPV